MTDSIYWNMNIEKELESIFDDPLLNVSPTEAGLFDIPKEMKQIMEHRHQAEYVAQTKPCANFEQYRPLFEQIHRELQRGLRQLTQVVRTATLEAGRYYVVDGQLIYLEQVGQRMISSNGLPDARTRCIYENGTESDILLQTLRKSVASKGYTVTLLQEEVECFAKQEEVDPEDIVTGYIYVLRSLSENPAIRNQRDLYKIGFSTNRVEERIANAEREPTYLMAPVEIVASYKIVNLHTQKLEHLIHTVLQRVQFHIVVTDEEGKQYHPKEWFVVQLPMVEQIISRIEDGSIVGYTYNPQLKCLEEMKA
ncbi:MAG: GIY-YIG nuclease family protein [Bacteroides sp.]